MQAFHGRHIEVEIDDRDIRGGEKNWSWVKKGVPIRIEVGPRDMADDAVFMARRDRPAKDKKGVARTEFVSSITSTLEDIQQTLLRRATEFRDEHTHRIDTEQDFRDFFTAPAGEPTPIHAGFAMTHFSGDSDVEEKIKNDLGVTVRCIPTELGEPGTCPFTGKPSAGRVVWAKSY